MPSTTTREPVASAGAVREAEALHDLAVQATRRANLLTYGRIDHNPQAQALALVCAVAIESEDDLGLDRGTDWTDNVLDMMQLLGRKGNR